MCSIACSREQSIQDLYDLNEETDLVHLRHSDVSLYQRARTDFGFPRIVIKDQTGKTLDTYTSLQEAIYRAKWNIQTSKTSLTPEEWRLPKAPLPSRPDFTRRGPIPPISSKEKYSSRVTQSAPPGSLGLTGIDDVAYVAESIRHLPRGPLHDNFTIGDKVYLQIVTNLLMHRKTLTETEKRYATYEFPGFCKGCQRSGLCYGCDMDSHPHIHRDRAMKTGGGYTFFKKDRPMNAKKDKNPNYWPVTVPAVELRQLIEDKSLSEAAKTSLKKRMTAQYPWLQDIPLDHTTLDNLRSMGLLAEEGQAWKEDEEDLEDEGIVTGDADAEFLSRSHLEELMALDEADADVSSPASRRHSRLRTRSTEKWTRGSERRNQSSEKYYRSPDARSRSSDKYYRGSDGHSRSSDKHYRGPEVRSRSSDKRSVEFSGLEADDGRYRDTERDWDIKKEGSVTTEDSDTKSQRAKLYNAPKPFALKKKERRVTVSESPFSKNRQYNISKGPGFQLKKNDKDTTKFEDFRRSNSDWKEPNRFELKKAERKITQFYTPKPESKKKKQPERDNYGDYENKRNRKILERPLSPDSGLASEIVSALRHHFGLATTDKFQRKIDVMPTCVTYENEPTENPENYHSESLHRNTDRDTSDILESLGNMSDERQNSIDSLVYHIIEFIHKNITDDMTESFIKIMERILLLLFQNGVCGSQIEAVLSSKDLLKLITDLMEQIKIDQSQQELHLGDEGELWEVLQKLRNCFQQLCQEDQSNEGSHAACSLDEWFDQSYKSMDNGEIEDFESLISENLQTNLENTRSENVKNRRHQPTADSSGDNSNRELKSMGRQLQPNVYSVEDNSNRELKSMGRQLQPIGDNSNRELKSMGRQLQPNVYLVEENSNRELKYMGRELQKTADSSGDNSNDELKSMGRQFQTTSVSRGDNSNIELKTMGRELQQTADSRRDNSNREPISIRTELQPNVFSVGDNRELKSIGRQLQRTVEEETTLRKPTPNNFTKEDNFNRKLKSMGRELQQIVVARNELSNPSQSIQISKLRPLENSCSELSKSFYVEDIQFIKVNNDENPKMKQTNNTAKLGLDWKGRNKLKHMNNSFKNVILNSSYAGHDNKGGNSLNTGHENKGGNSFNTEEYKGSNSLNTGHENKGANSFDPFNQDGSVHWDERGKRNIKMKKKIKICSSDLPDVKTHIVKMNRRPDCKPSQHSLRVSHHTLSVTGDEKQKENLSVKETKMTQLYENSTNVESNSHNFCVGTDAKENLFQVPLLQVDRLHQSVYHLSGSDGISHSIVPLIRQRGNLSFMKTKHFNSRRPPAKQLKLRDDPLTNSNVEMLVKSDLGPLTDHTSITSSPRSKKKKTLRKKPNESLKDSLLDHDSSLQISVTETEPELSDLTQKSEPLKDKSPSPIPSPEITRRERKPIIKKTRTPLPPRPRSPPKPPTPEPLPPPRREPTPEPPSREPTPPPPVEDEEYTATISMPDLPEFELEKKEAQKKQSKKFFVEAPPALKEQPKKRKAPPKVIRLPKVKYNRKSRPAEAPVTSDKLQEIQDPLDFLAKYCIINPNRLPFYQLVFEAIIADQSPPYTRENLTTKISEHEKKLMKDLVVLNHGHADKIGLSPSEEYLEKICYTLETIHDKMEKLTLDLQNIEDHRLTLLAAAARGLFPGISSPDYSPPKKKKGKKGKKKGAEIIGLSFSRGRRDVTDDIIVDRLTSDMITLLNKDSQVRQMNVERERTMEKITGLTDRLQQLQGQKILVDALSAGCYFEFQTENQKPDQFRRKQSALYNTLRPDPDFEMSLDELEESLQQINNHLLTEQEFRFIYFVLDLPGRRRINFRLFTVIAALSEKVTQLDPVIRKLINKFDYNALNVKMDKCKELFSLLTDDDLSTPHGGASATSLALELIAGGLKPEHVHYVLSKFSREGKGMFDFLDFVTYIPLFIEIHQRIVHDPLCEDQDL